MDTTDDHHDEEEFSLDLKKSRKAFMFEYTCALALIAISIVSFSKGLFPFLIYPFLIGIAFAAVGSAEFSRILHRCKITGSKIVITDGIIRQQKKHIFITSITDINTRQDFNGRLLGYGTIHLKSSSGEQALHLRDVNRPEKVMDQIEVLIEKYKNTNHHQ